MNKIVQRTRRYTKILKLVRTQAAADRRIWAWIKTITAAPTRTGYARHDQFQATT